MSDRPRGTDRRARYTQEAIRRSLLTLMKQKNFRRITVTEVCSAAEINRGTFYLHYADLDDVLDELLTEMTENTASVVGHIVCGDAKCGAYPFCEKIRNNEQYQTLFMDESITKKVIEKIAAVSKDDYISALTERTKLSAREAEAVFYFQLHGCLTFNRLMIQNKYADWGKIQSVVDEFIKAGIEHFMTR